MYTYDFEAVLERYRTKKTSEMRRDVIKDAAKEYGVPASTIARDLLAAGEAVDRRLVRYSANRYPEADAEPEAVRDITEADLVPAPKSKLDPEEPPAQKAMTLDTLRTLLTGIDGGAEIITSENGDLVTGLELCAVFDAEGNRTRCSVMLLVG